MAVALVTGASRGIGKAITLALAREGYDLFLVSRNGDELGEVREEARALAPREITVYYRPVDLSLASGPGLVFEAFRPSFDRLDVLVNNAGTALSLPIGAYSEGDWDRVMTLNARTPFFLIQHALPMLRKADPGFIINIGSVVSVKGYPNQSVYTASKHALLGMTKAIARETADDNVRVHAILPGGVASDLIHDVRPDIDPEQLISPEEVAESVTYLLSMRGNAVVDQIELRRKGKTPWA